MAHTFYNNQIGILKITLTGINSPKNSTLKFSQHLFIKFNCEVLRMILELNHLTYQQMHFFFKSLFCMTTQLVINGHKNGTGIVPSGRKHRPSHSASSNAADFPTRAARGVLRPTEPAGQEVETEEPDLLLPPV